MKLYKILFCAIMTFMCGTLYASDDVVSFTIGDKDGKELTVEPGGTVDAYIFLSCSDANVVTRLCSGQAWLVLPDGFELAGTPEAVEENWNYSSNLEISTDEEGWWYMVAKSSATAATFPKIKAEGPIYKFTIKATSAEASEDPYVASFDALWIDDNVEGTTVETRYVIDDLEDEHLQFNITVGAAAVETEKITLTKEYNTYIPAKALDFSSVEGIKAYYVTAVTATEATITETTTVAAGEGIILKGTAEAEYEVPVASGEVAKNDDNLLKTEGIAVNDYILYNGKFVLCSDGELADGKAYLPASAFTTSGAKVINIVFGGESTGINEIQKAEADGAIYNLSGMRVSKTQKGVYIMNGRKVIVK